jgi:hypothetical protein
MLRMRYPLGRLKNNSHSGGVGSVASHEGPPLLILLALLIPEEEEEHLRKH